jgi:hypothetical protein
MLNTMTSKYANRMYVGDKMEKQYAEGRETRCVSASALTHHASRTRVHQQARVRPSCRGMAIIVLMRQLVCAVSGGRVTGWR